MAIVQYIKLCVPQGLVFAIRNEGNRGVLGQQIAVAMGLLPGLHDLCLLSPYGNLWIPYFIEVKCPGKSLTGEQPSIHAMFRELGIKHCVARSVDDVADALAFWNIETIEKRPERRQENIDGTVRA